MSGKESFIEEIDKALKEKNKRKQRLKRKPSKITYKRSRSKKIVPYKKEKYQNWDQYIEGYED